MRLLEGLLVMVSVGLGMSTHSVLRSVGPQVSDIEIHCTSSNILVTVNTPEEEFNGMIYPKGLSKNSSCLTEYEHAGNRISYKLPLRACNTMSHDTKDGVEYFNTVVIQPHSKLVTSLGKGFQVRCHYSTKKNQTVQSPKRTGNSLSISPPAEYNLPLPSVAMKIYLGRSHKVAEHVKIGDYLNLEISMDESAGKDFGMKVVNCIVRDGLAETEQPLVNNEGCPIDEEIFGHFEYDANLTNAHVTYPAFKFPITDSIYYQCNVKLCLKKNNGCDDTPPICDEIGQNVRRRRRKRQSDVAVGNSDLRQDEDVRDRSVEVYSGLYVNEVDDDDDADDADRSSSVLTPNDDEFCVSQRKFAIGISIGGLLLMLAIILLVACIVHRRRRRKGTSTSGSSIYSGPYSNHAYSRD